jgi:hypothetical protein
MLTIEAASFSIGPDGSAWKYHSGIPNPEFTLSYHAKLMIPKRNIPSPSPAAPIVFDGPNRCGDNRRNRRQEQDQMELFV